MSTNTIVDRAIAGSGHRAKKTATFLEQKPKIEEALARGASERGIYRELKKDGCDVGSLTWFRRLVAKHIGGAPEATADSPTTTTTATTTMSEAAMTAAPVTGQFGDGRFAPDYE